MLFRSYQPDSQFWTGEILVGYGIAFELPRDQYTYRGIPEYSRQLLAIDGKSRHGHAGLCRLDLYGDNDGLGDVDPY